MSFNIPILFNDDPFFESDTYFRRQPRNIEERRPDVSQTWAKHDPIFEESRQGLFNRPSYQHRPRRVVPMKPSRRSQQNREFEENENIDDPEEFRGVTGNMRDLGGLDGWEIPVQFVGSPEHSHARRPQQHSTRPSVEEEQATRQRAYKVVYRPKHERNTRERMPDEVQIDESKSTEKADEETRMESEPKNDEDDKSIDSNENNKENVSDHEIPVQHSYKREKPLEERRHSRRLSQCDPPSLAEIKIARIQSILQKTDGMEEKIKEFDGPLQNKKFLYMSETLMRALLDLDNVDSEGLDGVRNARKEGVRTIQSMVGKLENKLAENKIYKASK